MSRLKYQFSYDHWSFELNQYLSIQLGKIFQEVVSAAVEPSRAKADMVAQADGKFGPEADPRILPNQ